MFQDMLSRRAIHWYFILSKPQRFDGDHQAFKKEDDWEVEDDYGTWRLSMPGSL